MTFNTSTNTVGKTFGWEAPPGADPFTHYVSGIAAQDATGSMFEMPIISHVKGNLWQGGFVENLNLGEHFDSIISLYPWEKYPTNGVTYTWEMYDGGQVDKRTIEAAAGQVQACLDAGQTVLVHCQAGLNRSGVVVARVLMEQGMHVREAIDLMRSKRSRSVLCNPFFVDYLMEKEAARCE